MKKYLFYLTALLILLSCDNNTIPDQKISIGANIYNSADNYMELIVKPELISYSTVKEATINIVDSAGNHSLLLTQIDNFISAEVDVLLINMVDPSGAGAIIGKAANAEIPLILFNKEPSDISIMSTYDKLWFVGDDFNNSGTVQGEMMLAGWNENPLWDKNGDDEIQYVILKGAAGHPVADARSTRSIAEFTNAGIQVEELASGSDENWSTQYGTDKMTEWLGSAFADDIEMVICNNDGMAFGAVSALETAVKQIPVFGIDALDLAVDYISQGEMDGTVLNDGVNVARAAIDFALNAVSGKTNITEGTTLILENDGSKRLYIPYIAITLENYMNY